MGTSKGFTGQYNDSLTGLDYYHARYYDPKVGAFLSADPVEGNPETWSDPTGLGATICGVSDCQGGGEIGGSGGGTDTAVLDGSASAASGTGSGGSASSGNNLLKAIGIAIAAVLGWIAGGYLGHAVTGSSQGTSASPSATAAASSVQDTSDVVNSLIWAAHHHKLQPQLQPGGGSSGGGSGGKPPVSPPNPPEDNQPQSAMNQGRQTLFHYTSEEGLSDILASKSLNPSVNPINARYGPGQYLTDIPPEQIGANTISDLTAEQIEQGLISRSQLARRLFGQPWAGNKLEAFLEIDVTDLTVENPVPNIFRIPGTSPLDLVDRIIRFGILSFGP